MNADLSSEMQSLMEWRYRQDELLTASLNRPVSEWLVVTGI